MISVTKYSDESNFQGQSRYLSLHFQVTMHPVRESKIKSLKQLLTSPPGSEENKDCLPAAVQAPVSTYTAPDLMLREWLTKATYKRKLLIWKLRAPEG